MVTFMLELRIQLPTRENPAFLRSVRLTRMLEFMMHFTYEGKTFLLKQTSQVNAHVGIQDLVTH